MKKCTYCGKEYPEDAVVCAIDQEPLQSDSPAPAADPVDGDSAAAPVPADDGFEVPEGYLLLGSFDAFEAARLLRQFEPDGIRFLIDRIEKSLETGRGVRKQNLIQIYVHQEDQERANQILSQDWKV
jgi:hypothetical protein